MGKFIDMTGQRFGRLVVRERVGTLRNRPSWLCDCDCGGIKITTRDKLIGEETKSCGCLQKETMKEIRSLKLEGKRFGRLTAIKMVGQTENHNNLWLCYCDCGGSIITTASSLKQGEVKSCGCLISKGEEKIKTLLSKNKIPFDTQFCFDDCKFPDTNHHAKFDFYINQEYVIEYDGEQHFKESAGWFEAENFQRRKMKDHYKNQYCFQNSIPIIHIPYKQYNKLTINDLLIQTSNFVLTPENEKIYYSYEDGIYGGDLQWNQ